MSARTRFLLAAVLISHFPVQTAAAAEAEPVVISGIRNPELKTYRVMLAGLDAFDEYHAMAPDAPEVRFKLRAKNDAPHVDLAGLALRIAGDQVSIPLPIAADNTFSLPRDAQARAEDADLLLNKPKGGYRWSADIHSRGVPAGMRRLGDLRLECKVIVAIAKEEIGFMLRAVVNSFLLTTDWCAHEKVHMEKVETRKLSAATLIVGEQRIPLPVSKNGMRYTPPLPDNTYPDDTLIEIAYADEAVAVAE